MHGGVREADPEKRPMFPVKQSDPPPAPAAGVLICHKRAPFPTGEDKGQAAHERHAFLM